MFVSDLTAEQAQRLADESFGGDLSGLISSLIDLEARRVDSLRAVAEWEAIHGQISTAEIASARARWLH